MHPFAVKVGSCTKTDKHNKTAVTYQLTPTTRIKVGPYRCFCYIDRLMLISRSLGDAIRLRGQPYSKFRKARDLASEHRARRTFVSFVHCLV